MPTTAAHGPKGKYAIKTWKFSVICLFVTEKIQKHFYDINISFTVFYTGKGSVNLRNILPLDKEHRN